MSTGPHEGADVPLASPGARLWSVVIDLIVFSSVLLCCFVVGATSLLLSSNFGKVPPSDAAYTVFQWVLFASAPVWDIILLTGWIRSGRSPGKFVTNTKIVGPGGRPIGPIRAFLRFFVYPLTLPTYLVIAFIAFLNALGRPIAFGAGLLALATFLASIVSLTLLFSDRRHRTVHDFLAGTHVRRLT